MQINKYSKENILIAGPAGQLEVVINHCNSNNTKVGVICHPDPKQAGNMDNKVVTTLARTFNYLGFPAIRFNFRGIGKSSGQYGNVFGEVEDCLAVIKWLRSKWSHAELWLAGFSFGSYIAALIAAQESIAELITIAPPVEKYNFDKDLVSKINCPWLICMGDQDEIVSSSAVYSWYTQLQANKSLIKFPTAGHFFHGLLIELQQQIINHYLLSGFKIG